MADEMPKEMHLSENPLPYAPDSNQNMRCLICDANIVTFSGYHILYTVIESSGSLLCDCINKVLKRNLETVTARSTIVCKRCYSLLGELDEAEKKCAFIKNEIESTYLKTCETYNDELSINVPGVACQTENFEFEITELPENQSDLKLKISLTPKRRRGRPAKSQQSIQDVSSKNIESVLEAQETENPKINNKMKDNPEKEEVTITYNVGKIVQSRQTRSTTKNNIKKKHSAPAETEQENPFIKEEIEASVIAIVEPENNIEVKNEIKADLEMESRENSQEILNNNQNAVTSEADDFEWKEEPLGGIDDESSENDDDTEDKSGDKNEDDWQSSSSKDSKTKQKKKKKKKRGDRKGERAFMVPIHECNQCGKKWRTVTELKSHIASHSDVRPYVCEICGQAYKMKKALDIHIGMHNGIHPFVCQYCNKSFTQKVGLEKHLPIHTGVTRFQCDLCGKRFIHQKSFNIHKMTHTGEKNIHCPICNLAVFSQSHLKRHYRVHTGERPYGCNICGKKFAEKYNLNAHARIHDPNSAGEGRRRSHTCPVCGMTYDRKHKMADHLSSVHGMWQSSTSLEFKSEDFYNIEVQTMETQHLLPLQVQQANIMQPQQIQTVLPQQPSSHSHQPQRVSQSQTAQISAPQLPPQAQQTSLQMSQTLQPQQHHHIVHSSQQQQLSPLHLQQQVQSSGPTHHILLTQHRVQQTLETHMSHHPTVTTSIDVAAATPSALQPISSVFQLVPVPSSPPDTVVAHHNRINPMSASMPVPTL